MVSIDYTDLTTVRKYLSITVVDAGIDELIEDSITAASREIDRRTNRYFGQSGVATEREFTSLDGVCFVDDIVVSELVTSSHDGTFLPRNGVVNGQEGFPFDRIEDPSLREGDVITIEAVWGWAEVPSVIVELAKKIAAKFFMDKDVPLGVKGLDDFGLIRVREPMDIEKKLILYTRNYLQVG